MSEITTPVTSQSSEAVSEIAEKYSTTDLPVLEVTRFLIVANGERHEARFVHNNAFFRAVAVREVEDGWIVRNPIAIDHKSRVWFSFVVDEVKLRGEAITDAEAPRSGGGEA